MSARTKHGRTSPAPLGAIALGALGALAVTSSCGGMMESSPKRSAQARAADGTVAPSPTGLDFPMDYRNWSVLGVAHRIDKQTMRVVIGNPTAIDAAKRGRTNPWPDGSGIGNIVWQQEANPNWTNAIGAGAFVRAEFMFKSVAANTENDSGWAWGRWVGSDLVPDGSGSDADQQCIDCHVKVSGSDWVFTRPIRLP